MNKKYANCGASVKPNGKAKMYGGGMAMKKKKPSYNMGGMAMKKKKVGNASGNMGIKNS
tara:strand:+ start:925 stop:1101 length:177 start_codon:yes stop_codon:yes gene_type:complete